MRSRKLLFEDLGCDTNLQSRWLLNGQVIRTLRKSDTDQFPSQAQRFKVTLWDGSEYDNWAGKSNSANFPQYAYFDWIKFTPSC
jgi:beta-glucanase (GH16 family)